MSDYKTRPFKLVQLNPNTSNVIRKAGGVDLSSLRDWKCPKCKKVNPMSSYWCSCNTKNPYK